MEDVLEMVTGGAILKCMVSAESNHSGNNAPQTLTALGIEHVATVFNIKAMKRKAELFVNLQHGFIVIVLFSLCFLSRREESFKNKLFSCSHADR